MESSRRKLTLERERVHNSFEAKSLRFHLCPSIESLQRLKERQQVRRLFRRQVAEQVIGH
jgi:hypothetical protein